MGTPLYNTDIIPLTSRPTLTVMDDGDYFVILDTSTGKISKILRTDVQKAMNISYDNTTSGLTATQVQAALDELVVNLGSSDNAISALAGRLDILEADELTEGSIAYDIKQSSDAIKGTGYTEGTLKTHEDRLDTAELTLARTNQDLASVKQTLQQGNGATLDFSGISTVPLDARATGRANPTVYGLTATNLVENGDFSQGTAGWQGMGSALTESGKVLTDTGDGTEAQPKAFQLIGKLISGDKWFISVPRVRVTNSLCIRLIVRWYGSSTIGTVVIVNEIASPTENTWYDLSGITTVTNQSGRLRLQIEHFYGLASDATGKVMEIDGNYGVTAINLTSIFGAGNEPSEADCAKIFSYFDGTKSISMPARLRSVGKNLFDNKLTPSKTAYYLNYGTGKETPLPGSSSAISHYIEVSPSTTYTISGYTPNVNTGYMFYDSNKSLLPVVAEQRMSPNPKTITTHQNAKFLRLSLSLNYYDTIQLELGSAATPYEPYTDSTLYIADNEEVRSVPAISDEVKVINGQLVKVQNVQRYVLQESDFSGSFVSAISTWNIGGADLGVLQGQNTSIVGGSITGKALFPVREISFNSRKTVVLTDDCFYVNSSGTFTIAFPANKYTSIEDLMAVYVGTVIYYQLATPIITPLTTSGILQAKPKGTVYFEPYYEGSYQTDASSEITLPYTGTIDKVYGYDENLTEYLLDASEYSLTGTTLTITGALENEVFFVQMSRSEPLAPEMSVNVLNNEQVIADTSNGKFYKLVPTITNGALVNQTPVEVV